MDADQWSTITPLCTTRLVKVELIVGDFFDRLPLRGVSLSSVPCDPSAVSTMQRKGAA